MGQGLNIYGVFMMSQPIKWIFYMHCALTQVQVIIFSEQQNKTWKNK